MARDRITLPLLAIEAVRLAGSLAVAAVVAGWAAGLFGQARGHEAPSGWAYDAACCSGQDCRPAAPGEVTSGPGGFRIGPTGELIPFASSKVRPSGDGALHRCSVGGEAAGATLCLYVPGGA